LPLRVARDENRADPRKKSSSVNGAASLSAGAFRLVKGGDREVARVTAGEIVGSEVLPPIFAGFRDRHPGIALELAVTNRSEDLSQGDADIAARMIRTTQSALVACSSVAALA
jgi:DNA-binding transcriptional LysR family regulator